jgi:hypothetical protein
MRSHRPDDVAPGVQYTPNQVRALLCSCCAGVNVERGAVVTIQMCSLCLTSQAHLFLSFMGLNLEPRHVPDLTAFCNVRHLNLAKNQLFSITGMGIENMTSLVTLDLHDNILAYVQPLASDVTSCHVMSCHVMSCHVCYDAL